MGELAAVNAEEEKKRKQVEEDEEFAKSLVTNEVKKQKIADLQVADDEIIAQRMGAAPGSLPPVGRTRGEAKAAKKADTADRASRAVGGTMPAHDPASSKSTAIVVDFRKSE